MAKKSKSKKSKAKKTKSESPEAKSETPDEAKLPTEAVSPSTDDVYNLLKAVNEVTLKRIENKIDYLTQRLAPAPDQTKAINDRLKAIQEVDLMGTRQAVDSVFSFLNNPLYAIITAIKSKTDKLP
jgi:hypothetical protein